jgi:hypothetical protein
MSKTKECKACRSQIDSRASICPVCRTKQPDPNKGILLLVCAGFIGAIWLFNSFKAETPASALVKAEPKVAAKVEPAPPPPPPPTPANGEEVSEEFFNYLKLEVSYRCQQQIQAQVKYEIRSPGVLYGTNTGAGALLRFSRWSKYVSDDGTITIRGDEAEAQNGFGNWLKVNYSCTIDVATKQVKYATISDGRLPPIGR